MKRVVIKKSFFYSAGSKYGWSETHDKRGVGVNLEFIKDNPSLEIEVDGVLYWLNQSDAIPFIREFKSVEDHKGTKVAIISKSLLRELSRPSKQVQQESTDEFSPPVSPTKVLQSSLF